MSLARELIHEIRSFRMAIDALNASIAELAKNVGALIAAEANTVPQAQVDAAQAAVDAVNATVVAALPAPAPAPAG